MECCLSHLILPNQHVSVKPLVCHRECDGRRPETTSHAWSAIFAISRWSETIADSRLQNAVRGKAELAEGGKLQVSAAVSRPRLKRPRETRKLFFVMKTKNYSQNIFI